MYYVNSTHIEAVREALGEEADLIQQLINILISCIANVYNDATLRVLCSCLLALTNLAFDSDNNKLAIVKIGGEILAKLVPIYGQLEVTAFFLTMLLRNLVNSGTLNVFPRDNHCIHN